MKGRPQKTLRSRAMMAVSALAMMALSVSALNVNWDQHYPFDYWGDAPAAFFDENLGYLQPFAMVAQDGNTQDTQLVNDAKYGKGAAKMTAATGVMTGGLPMNATSAFSISVWVKLEAGGGTDDRALFSTVDADVSIAILLDRNNEIRFATRVGSGGWHRSQSCGTFNVTVWVHVAIVKSGTTWTLYLDAKIAGTFEVPANMYHNNHNQKCYLMGHPNWPTCACTGTIDNLRVILRALLGPEIADLFENDTGAVDVPDYPDMWSADCEHHTQIWSKAPRLLTRLSASWFLMAVINVLLRSLWIWLVM